MLLTIVRNIFIHRIDGVLGCYFAGRCLGGSSDRVFYSPCVRNVLTAGEIADLVWHAAEEAAALTGAASLPEIKQRFYRLGRDIDVHALGPNAGTCVNEAWYFVNSAATSDRTERLDDLISASATMGAQEFNYVEFDCTGAYSRVEHNKRGAAASGNATEKEIEKNIEQSSKAYGVEYRIFRTSLVLGEGSATVQHAGSFLAFLSVLHSLKAEIEERSPRYFDFHALRYCAGDDADTNLISASIASDILLKLARAKGTANSKFWIASPRNVALSQICENIGIAYNLSLLPSTDPGELNAVDRAFLAQLEQAQHRPFIRSEPAHETPFELANLPPESAVMGAERQVGFFESVRRKQDEDLAAKRRDVETLPSRLETKTTPRNGSELKYFAGGKTGPPVVVLNALGQGLKYWHRLLNHLMGTHRVFIWEPRGTSAPSPPFGLADHVDDLEAVLHHEGIESCHLIGWCTGPKVAIDFHLRRPSAVKSMAFLNGTLKCDGSPEELDSPYEHNLESLCRMLVKKPAMAASVRKTLHSREEESETEILEGSDQEQMSARVLSLMNVDLRSDVLAPFTTAETTLNYARQLVEFWTHDVRPKAARIQIPVLLLSAEYDQVATPAASVAAADLFPKARHVHVKGATHYCLYDRSEFVADLLTAFFANPEKFVTQRV